MPNKSKYDTEVIVVGAGLSGLATALLLHEEGVTVRVLEANSRPGGRIHSVYSKNDNVYLADLGPTWVWPKYQPIVEKWLEKIGIETFPQYEQGNAILDYGPDTQPEIRYLPGQDGSTRILGGTQAIIDRIVAKLPRDSIHLNSHVSSITTSSDGVNFRLQNEDQTTLRSMSAVIAVPPRIAAKTISWQPELIAPLKDALDQTPTWMSPHAKVVAIYDHPFWRERGLSGRIASNNGPIVEAHDHCGLDGSPAAIFGFIGLAHDQRAQLGIKLEQLISDQLKRCFGAGSPLPLSIHIEDWATSPTVTTSRDLSEPMQHPRVRPNFLRDSHVQGRLFFGGAETAQQSPGLIEGAFDAAERVAKDVLRSHAGMPGMISED